MKVLFLVLQSFILSVSFANTKNDPHIPISHCYHWLDEGSQQYLSFKYSYAEANKNELTFFTTPATSNGSIAGEGLYCAKSPSGSYGYGDRVIRIDFVDDVVLLDEGRNIQYCGLNGENSSTSTECAKKPWDVKFYQGGGIGNRAWYVIQNPEAIKTWSSSSNQLISDLEASVLLNDEKFQAHAQKTIQSIQNEMNSLGDRTYHTMNTRSSIVETIINDPDKLRQIPALNIVQRLVIDQSQKITESEREDIYLQSLKRAISDQDLTYKSLKTVIDKEDNLQVLFIKILNEHARNFKQYNTLIFLEAFSDTSLNTSLEYKNIIKHMVEYLFIKPGVLKKLAESKILLNQKIKPYIINELNQSMPLRAFINGSLEYVTLYKKVLSKAEYEQKISHIHDKLKQLNVESPVRMIVNEQSFGMYDKDNFNFCQAILTTNLDIKKLSVKFNDLNISLDQLLSQSKPDICKNIASISTSLASTDITDVKNANYFITGKIDQFPYAFIVEHLEQVTPQCEDYVNKNFPNQRARNYSWSINGDQIESKKSPYRPRESATIVCDRLKLYISYKVLTKNQLVERKKYQQRKGELIQNNQDPDELFSVAGRFDKAYYFFYGTNLSEFKTQCLNFIESNKIERNINNVFTWGINGEKYKNVTRMDYESSSNGFCEEFIIRISAKIPSKWLQDAKDKYEDRKQEYISSTHGLNDFFLITGGFQNTKFYYFGETIEEIQTQCLLHLGNLESKPFIRKFNWSINAGQSQIASNRYRRFDSVEKICFKLLDEVKTYIPSKHTLKNKKNYQKLKDELSETPGQLSDLYTVGGAFEKAEYFFFGRTIEDFKSQCTAFSDSIREGVRDITWKINDGSLDSTSLLYQADKENICSKFLGLIAANIPLKKYLELKKQYEGEKSEWINAKKNLDYLFTVSGYFDTVPFHFFGESAEELRGQCLEYQSKLKFLKSISTTKWQIQKSSSDKIIKRSYFITRNNEEICSSLYEAVAEIIPYKIELAKYRKYHSNINAVIDEYNNSFVNYKIVITHSPKYKFYFYGNNRAEIRKQCDEVNNKRVIPLDSSVYNYTLNNKAYSKDVKDRAYLSYCTNLIFVISDEVPSQLDVMMYEAKKAIFNTHIKSRYTRFSSTNSRYQISGVINNYDFYLYANHLEGLKSQCQRTMDLYPTKSKGEINKDIYVQLEYQDRKRYKSPIMLLSRKDQLCEKLITKLNNRFYTLTKTEYEKSQFLEKQERVYSTSTKRFNHKLYINDEVLYISVNAIEEFSDECLKNSIYMTNISKSNTVKSNDLPETSFELEVQSRHGLCQRLEQLLIPVIPPELSEKLRIEQEESDYQLKVSGLLGVIPFYFSGKHLDDLEEECDFYFNKLENLNEKYEIEIEKFSWSTNFHEKDYYIGDSRTLKSRRKTCKLFEKTLKKQLKGR